MVTLRGVNIPSLGWGNGEHLDESIREACDNWNANLIRLSVSSASWTTSSTYRDRIYRLVDAISARNKYMIFDCHSYVIPNETDAEMWEMVSKDSKLANNPAVLFGLCNEPHDIRGAEGDAGRDEMDLWKNGGKIQGSDGTFTSIGHQGLVEMIRDNGAKNILIAGGTGWGWNLGGLANENGFTEYALTDHGSNNDMSKTGNGIMYDSHIYPNKGNMINWNNRVGVMRKWAPVLIGEFGIDRADGTVTGNETTQSNLYVPTLMDWMEDTEGRYDGVPANWTGWNLHPSSTPRMIRDWTFDPTTYNGAYVKDALAKLNQAKSYDNEYSADFSSNPGFSYTTLAGTASAEIASGILEFTYDNKNVSSALSVNLPLNWVLNGVQKLEFDMTANSKSNTFQIGFYGADTEIWAKDVSLTAGQTTRITIPVNELTKRNNPTADGLLTGSIMGIYLSPKDVAPNMFDAVEIDNLKITTSSAPTLSAPSTPYQPPADVTFDFESTAFSGYGGKRNESQEMTYEVASPGVKADGTDEPGGKAMTITYKAPPEGKSFVGYVEMQLSTEMAQKLEGARYFSFCLKTDQATVGQGFDISLQNSNGSHKYGKRLQHAAGNTEWTQYVIDFEEIGLINPCELARICFYVGKSDDTLHLDNLAFTREYPAFMPSKNIVSAVYTFEQKTASKPDPAWYTIDGAEGDSISEAFNTTGFESPRGGTITYHRTDGTPAALALDLTGSDFKKAWPEFYDLDLTRYLVFDARSVSGSSIDLDISIKTGDGKQEKYYLYQSSSVTKRIGTGWQRIAIPLTDFLINGKGQTNGWLTQIIFAVKTPNVSGNLLIDNIALSSNPTFILNEDYSNTYDLLTPTTNVFAGKAWRMEQDAGAAGYLRMTPGPTNGYQSAPGLALDINSNANVNRMVVENPDWKNIDFQNAKYLTTMIHGGTEYLFDGNRKTYATNKIKVEFLSSKTDYSAPPATYIENFDGDSVLTWEGSTMSASSDGVDNTGAVVFASTAADAQYAIAPIPSSWNFSQLGSKAWVSFSTNSSKDAQINIAFLDENKEVIGNPGYSGKLQMYWQQSAFEFGDISQAKYIRFGKTNAGSNVTVRLDNLTVSNQDLNPQVALTATIDASVGTWSHVTVPLDVGKGDLKSVNMMRVYSALNQPTPEDGTDQQVILSHMQLSGLPEEDLIVPEGTFTYKAAFDGDGVLELYNVGGYYSAADNYFANCRDKRYGRNGTTDASTLSNAGVQIQYHIANSTKIPAGSMPYAEGTLPYSWNLARAETMSFDILLGGKKETGDMELWNSGNEKGYGNLGAAPEDWENGLNPVFALLDEFGNEYTASVPVEYIGWHWQTVSIPITAFKNAAGENPEYSAIKKMRIYPDKNKGYGSFYLDNLTFSAKEPEPEPVPDFYIKTFTAQGANGENLSESGLLSGTVTATYEFAFSEEVEEKERVLTLLAITCKDGRTDKVQPIEVTITESNNTASVSIEADTAADTVKFLVWENKLSDMLPLKDEKAKTEIKKK
uniref:cellulase n=1 Tax=uncultured Bacillota bacterium TaxID=344338 RepID=A0A650ENZ3_9FIRM|nr:hypothetical protein Firmicute1046_0140 [uncultured Firmicutes bacterium]